LHFQAGVSTLNSAHSLQLLASLCYSLPVHVLGINFSNDAAAALVSEEGVLAAVTEERYARVKHHAGWPAASIRFCLQHAGLTLGDLDAVAFAWNPAVYMDTPLRRHQSWRHQTEYLAAVPNQLLPMLSGMGDVTHLEERLHFAGRHKPLRIVFVTHHLAHAASAFYVSPFEESAILTYDGYGERTSTLLLHGRGVELEELSRVEFPHSLGSLYAAITQHLGFRVNSGEGKVMGLASYGEPRFLPELQKMVRLLPRGRFEIDLSYFSYYLERPRRYTKKLLDALGPEREPESEIDARHKDIAASLQAMLEAALDHLLAHLATETRSRNLCMAGGVSLNCVANGRCFFRSAFRDLYIQPAAGDNGAALGAALYVLHKLEGAPRRFVLRHDCLGPENSDEEIARELQIRDVAAERVRDVARTGAALLAKGFILGWHQGRAEFGPRALGARSILADPRLADMKDVLNARVKFREYFRPFAPSVLAERVGDFFSPSFPSPFMLLCHDVLPEKREVVPAITHVDGTARIHSVERDVSPLYYALIEEFGRLTGVPMVLDTSFNIRGEPIVNSVKESLQCFLTTDMDFLLIGSFLLCKQKPACLQAVRELRETSGVL
jgi:carbamoyltransferase